MQRSWGYYTIFLFVSAEGLQNRTMILEKHYTIPRSGVLEYRGGKDLEKLRTALHEGLDAGLSKAQMQDFIAVLKAQVGQQEAEDAAAILQNVLGSRAK